ncbi:MAG: SulP family inorganic anion transporter [Myxococcales bacterium]
MTTDDTTPSPSLSSILGQDLSSALVVFLVALPLCLGIALASDAPLSAGILAGCIGGIIVGAVSGSHTSVSGPAAGLTAVVGTQIATLGSFEAFLTAVLVAGVMQVVLGLMKAGAIADFMPTSVIKGLLVAIGLILILKQLPHLVGHDDDPSGEMSFIQPDGESTFSELIGTLNQFHLGAAAIGLFSLALLIAWGRMQRLNQLVPGPLVVVVLGVAINEWFKGGSDARWVVGAKHLVEVPSSSGSEGVMALLRFPDLSQLLNPAILPAAITLALVASLETLLNLEAVDKLDPHKRVSPPSRELIAQGVGNMTAGLIGALPVTSVIVRSSVNINTGARTKLSAIAHGFMLFGAVVFLPHWLNRIPLASLAAILIVTGYKLANPKLAREMWAQGREMFLPFATTVGMILFTDLLVGVLTGLALAAAFILRSNLRRPIRRIIEKHVSGEVLRIELPNQVSFLNKLALSNILNEVPPGHHVLIDASHCDYIDPDVRSVLIEFERDTAPVRDIKVSAKGLKEHYEKVDDKLLFIDYATREARDKASHEQILEILREGNKRFADGVSINRDVEHLRQATKDDQHPLAVFLTGTSSRTPVEVIFDLSVGDVSCIRTTANWGGGGVVGSLEYAVLADGVKLIVFMGHTRNEAVRHAIEHRDFDAQEARYVQRLLQEVRASDEDGSVAQSWEQASEAERRECVDRLSRAHLVRTARHILDQSPDVRTAVHDGPVRVVGCMYDVQSGEAEFFDLLQTEGATVESLRPAAHSV